MLEKDPQCFPHSMTTARQGPTRNGATRSNWWIYWCSIFGILCLLQHPAVVDSAFACPGNCTCDTFKESGVKYQNVNCTGSGLTAVPSDDKEGADVVRLFLSHNQIGPDVNHSMFQYFTNLRELDLSYNQISSIDADTFDNLTSLQILNLGANVDLASLPSGLFDDPTALVTLNLTHNTIFDLTSLKFLAEDISVLDISHMLLTDFPRTSIKHLDNLLELYVNNNNITTIDRNDIDRNSLERLDLSYNKIDSFHYKALDNQDNLTYLNLSHNYIDSFHAATFEDAVNLTVLDLSNNLLTSLDEDTFEDTPSLTTLQLENNQLTSLPADVFEDLTALTTLDLENNNLTSLDATVFRHLSAINTIDLSGNLLSFLSNTTFSVFSSYSLDVSSNPFTCDCGFRNFLYAVSFDTSNNFVNQADTLCSISGKEYVYLDWDNSTCEGNLGSACSSNEACMAQNAFCNGTSGVCECKANFYDTNRKTIPAGLCNPQVVLDYPCDIDDACENSNSECSGVGIKRCLCIAGYYDDSPNYLGGNCHLQLDLGGACTFDDMCNTSDAYCGPANECICQSTHYDNNTASVDGGTCIPKFDLHAACTSTEQCGPTNSECSSSTCQCSTGYYEINNSGQCQGPSSFYSCYQYNTSSVNIHFEFAATKASTDECEEFCFTSNARYYLLVANVCICGNIEVNGTCCPLTTTECNHREYIGPTINYVTSGMSVSTYPELYVGQPYTFNVLTTLGNIDQIKWLFGASQTEVVVTGSSSSQANTYTYPGKYDMTIKACEQSSSVCDIITLPVRVQVPRENLTTYITGRALSPISECISDFNATFKLGYDFAYYWKMIDSGSVETWRQGCTTEWTAHRSKCIKHVTTPATFAAAQTACTGLGATLLKIDYLEEVGEVVTGLGGTASTVELLTAAQRVGGVWQWTSDSSKTVITNDDLTSSTGGDCVVIDGTTQSMTTVNCLASKQYVCMKDPVDCPYGGVSLDNNHCVVLGSSLSRYPMAWSSAQAYCESTVGGWLANITSATRHTTISNLLNDSSVSEAFFGLSQQYLEGSQFWADNTSYSGDYAPTIESSSGSCYVTKPGNIWAQEECNGMKDFVCEYSYNIERLTIPAYVHGTADVQMASGTTLQRVVPYDTFTDTTVSTNVWLFPGLVFSKSGNIRYWVVHTEHINSGESFDVAFLVFRPSCISGTLVQPGCDGTKFCTCATTGPTCTQNTCSSSQYFCYLSNRCKSFNESCTCNSESGSTTACSSSGTPPQYSLHAQTHATIAITGESTVIIPAADLSVSEYDVFGLQFETGQNVVKCEDLPSGDDQHSLYTADHTGWLSKGDGYPVSVKTDVDKTCYFHAVYTETEMKTLAPNVGCPTSVGVYDLSISIIDTDVRELDVTLEEAISDIDLIYPAVRETSTDTDSLGTIYTEYNVPVNVTLRVGIGNNKMFSFDSATPVSFQSVCPSSVESAVSADLCNSSLVWSALPYAYASFTPSALGTATKSVVLTNTLGTTTKYVTVKTEKRITGQTFALQTSALIANNVALNQVSSFQTAYTTGTAVEYSYLINGGSVSSTSSILTHTFTALGTYTVSSFLTNILSVESVNITVYAKQPAEVTALSFTGTPYIAVINVPIDIEIQCTVNANAEVSAEFYTADNNLTENLRTTTTIITSKSWTFSKTFTSTGLAVQVNATVKDPFTAVTVSTTVDVYNAVPSVDLLVTDNDVLSGNSVSFTATIPSTPGNYGNVEYTIEYGDTSTETSTSSTFSHTYAAVGAYTVNITGSNGPSAVYTTQTVTVYSAVSGLNAAYNGPNKKGDSTVFTASNSNGNFVSFRFYSSEFNITQTNGIFMHTFAAAGVHQVDITCFNALSSQTSSLTVYVLEANEIRVENLQLNGLAIPGPIESGVTNLYSVSVIHYDVTNLQYTFDFGDGTIQTATNPSYRYSYSTGANFTINVTVTYSTESASQSISTEICIQDRIESPSIGVADQVALPSSNMLDLSVGVTVTQGTSVGYVWTTNTTILGSSTASVINVQITSVGWYQFSVTLSNSINTVTESKVIEVIGEISGVTIDCPTCTEESDNLYVETGASATYTVQTSTGTSLSYSWDLGDGSNATSSSVSYTYSTIGSYSLTVSVYNDISRVNVTLTVYVESTLTSVTVRTSGFNWKTNLVSPTTKDGDMTIAAQFSADTQPSGMSPTYIWEFDTGLTLITTTTAITEYNFTTTGQKSCTVTAVNKIGSVTSQPLIVYILTQIENITVKEGTTKLDISIPHLIAQNGVYNISITSDQIIDNTVEYTIIIRHTSTMNLIGSGSGQSYSINFTRIGEYTLTTSVQNSLNKAEDVFTIEAIEPVSGQYINVDSGVDGNITAGSSITLYGGSTVGKYLTFSWIYVSAPSGHLLTSSDQNLTLTLGDVGVYVVRLTVSNPVSGNLDVEYTINVQEAVTGVTIQVTLTPPDAVLKGSTIVFHGGFTTGTDVSYSWRAIGDVNPLNADTEDFTITFALQAYYNITLEVSNYASTGTDVKRIYSLNELSSVNIQITGATYNNDAAKYLVVSGTPVTFTSDITIVEFVDFLWQTNSSSSTSEDFSETFTTTGTYYVQLTSSNKISSVSDQVILLVQDPISNFVVTGCNSTYLLSTDIALSSSLTAGTDVTVQWRGDGTSIGSAASVNYGTIGEHTINVTASNYVSEKFVTCIITTQGTITNLVATVSAYKFVGHAVTFHITGSYLTSASFIWKFSHGVTTTTTAPTLDQIFTLNGDYNVTVNVTNEVSWAIVSLNFTVENLKCALPTLRIDGSTERRAQRGRTVELEVTPSTGGCTDYLSVNGWVVYEASSCSDTLSTVYALPSSITTNTPILQISAATLPYNSYCVRFENSYSGTPVKIYSYFNLTIVESPLWASIAGGSARVDRAGTTLTLNGNGSRDLDSSDGVVLQYTWQCSQSMGTQAAIDVCNKINAVTVAWAELTGLTLTTSDVYDVSLTVSATARTSGYVKQQITIVDGSAPVVGIECISCEANENFKTSPDKKTCFQGTCSSGCTTSTTYLWTIEDTTTNTQLSIATSQTTTGTDSINLCLNAGTLTDNKSYKFKLQATTGSLVGFAEQSLNASTGPASGSCGLSSTGSRLVPLTNKVTVTCQNYVDQDTTSGLYYHIVASYGTDEYIVYFGSQSIVEFYLSPWPGTNYADVVITVYVVNDHGIQVMAVTENVQFKAPTLLLSQTDNVNYIVDQIIGTMPTQANQNNPNLLVRYITAVLLFLNDQSENGVNTTAVRMAIRDLLASALDGMPYTTVYDVRQIASAVKYLTDYPGELSKTTLTQVDTAISSLASMFDSSVKRGHDQNVFETESLQESIANIHSSLQSITSTTSDTATSTKFGTVDDYSLDISTSSSTTTYTSDAAMQTDLIKKSINYRTQLAAVQLQTLLADEQAITKTLTDGSVVIAEHVSVTNIGDGYSQSGVTIVTPTDIIDYTSYTQDSVFRISVFNSINPFTFGYDSVGTINTKTLQTGFLDLTGNDIAVSSLPSSKEVTLYMFADGVTPYDIPTTGLIGATGYSPRDGVTNTSCADLTGGTTKYITVPTSTTTGVHVRILPEYSSSQATGFLIATLSKNGVAYTSSDAITSVRPLNITYNIYANTQADHTTYTFFIPVSETGAFRISLLSNLNVHVCVAVYFTQCSYFNTNSDTWSNSGCTPQKESIPTVATCSCNHMTSYGSSVLLSPDQIDFTDLTDLDIVNNPVAIITCSVILALYIVLVIFSRRLDKLDMKHISSIPLCGKDGSFKYEVMVFTGRQLGAGTSAHVGIQLLGSYWKTARKHIYKEGAFQRNCCDTFIIAHDVNLGEVSKISIWHDNTGTSPSWYLDRVVVKDLQTDQQYYFYCHSWLTLESTHGAIQKTIPAAGAQERDRFGHKFNMAFFNSLADKHLWLSLLNRPAQSRFTRVQRATCCVTLLFTFICVNAMWYGLLKKDNQDLGWESFSWEEIILAIVTNVMVLPINLALIFLFKKSRSKANLFEIVQKPQTAESIEIENDCENSQGGSFDSRNTSDFPFDLDRESTIDSVPAYSRALHRSKNVSRRQTENADDQDCGKRLNIAVTSSSKSAHWDEGSNQKWQDDDDDDDGFDSRPSTSSTAPPPKSLKGLAAFKKRKTVGKIESEELLAELDKMEKDLTEAESRPVRSAGSRHSETSSRSRRLTMSELEGLEDILHSDDETSFDNKLSKKAKSRPGTRFNPRADPRINGNGRHLMSRGSAMSGMSNGEPEASGSRVTAGIRPLYYSELTMESRDIRHVPVHKEKCLLPPWCVYIAYTLCFLLCVFSVIIVILYCFKFGADEALKWVLACLLSLVLSFLVVEPLKALMIALYMVAMFKDVDKTDEDDCIEINPSIDLSHENIQEQVFVPISGFALVKAKEEGRKIQRMKTMIRQFFAYMFYLWTIMVVVYVHFHHNSYLFNKYVEHSFVNATTTNYVGYNNMSTIDEFWDWTENVFADSLHLQDSHTEEEHGFPLGPARMRLIRSVPEKCPAASASSSLGTSSLTERVCYGDGGFEEDTGFYGERWNESSYNKSWKYSWANQLGGSDKLGYMATYGGGGYIQTLGTSHAETLTIIQDLKDKAWIDLQTRAVVLEFSFYSPGSDMTAVTAMLVEFPLTGGVLTSYDILSQKLLWFQNNHVDPLMVMECILLIVVIYSCVHIVLQVREKRVAYFKEFWHWYEIITTLATIVSIGMYMGCVIEATNTFNNFLNDQSGFTNFERVAHVHVGMRYLYAWLLFLLMYKVVKQLRFIKFFYVFGETLSSASGHIVGAFLIYTILLLTYAQIGYLMYGRNVPGFETVGHAVSTLVVIIRGTFDFWPLLDHQPVFSHFYVVSYYAFAYGLLVALVIAILQSCYKISQSKIFYKDSLDMKDYEMIDFMMKRFKLWAGIKKPKPAFRRVHFPDLPQMPSRASTALSNRSVESTDSVTTFEPDTYQPYLSRMAGRLGPTWQLFLRRFDQLEVLDQEEQRLVMKTEALMKDLNLRCRINELERQEKEILSSHNTSKPPIRDSKQRQSQRLANPDNQGRKPPSTVTGVTSRAAGTPPSKEQNKPVLNKRPLSDQGARPEQLATRRASSPDKGKIQSFLRTVKPSKPAWSKDES